MRRIRWIMLCGLLLFAIVASWLWWVKPKRVDMATYAPADALLYLEANRPLEVVETIANTDAWKAFEKVVGNTASKPRSQWLQRFIGLTGIGPIQSVVLARAQIAVVVTELGTTEEGDTLNIKPEGAILVETHSAEGRVRPLFEQALKTLAEKTYNRPTSRRVTIDGVEFIEWNAPEGSRHIVGTIVGSLVIIGTSEHAVQNCLAVSQGRRPSLKNDPELSRMRNQLEGERALTFGYVPPGNSARLLAIGMPILLGRAPGDSEFQRLITTGAAEVFGSLGWTSRAYLTGIEDRYLISLRPSIVARLKPNFGSTKINSLMQRVLPDDIYSVTSYKFENPVAAWQSLKTAVSSQVDALSAIVFSSLLKSALLSYGIDDPETFLGAVKGELLTLRLDENGEHVILIAGVRDRAAFLELVRKKMAAKFASDNAKGTEMFEDSQGEFAVSFVNEFVVTGAPVDVRRYVAAMQARGTVLSAEKLKRIAFFVPSSSTANIVTYTNDGERVRRFISATISASGAPPVVTERIEEEIADLPYSATETALGDHGIERFTRSPLGQFGTFLPLLLPEKRSPLKNGTESK